MLSLIFNKLRKTIATCLLLALSANAAALRTVSITTDDPEVSEAGPTSASFIISRTDQEDIGQSLTVF